MSPKARVVKDVTMLRVLEKAGWRLHRVKGSHHTLLHETNNGVVVVPVHRQDLAIGTLNSILRQAGITREELERFLQLL